MSAESDRHYDGALADERGRRFDDVSTHREESDGFAVHSGILSAQDVERLLDAVGSLPHRTRAGARHLLAHPAVAEVARDRRLLELAGELLQAPPQPFRATLFEKTPTSNWLVVWHQDTALPLRERRDVAGWGPWSRKAGIVYAHAPAAALETVVALRVHLDDSTGRNGPLRVLPGTHALGVLSDATILDLARRVPARECLVGRGGVLAMRPLLVHASSKAEAPAPRRVLHLEYARSLTLDTGLELDIA